MYQVIVWGLLCVLLISRTSWAADYSDYPEDLSFLRQTQLLVPQTVPLFKADGQVTEAEQNASAQVQSFVTFEGAATGINNTTLHIAYTPSQLYVGFSVNVPTGHELRSMATQRDDQALWGQDDTMELRFIVQNRTYDFIGNVRGVRGDRRDRDASWKTDHWAYQARKTQTGWEGEFLFEAAAFDLTSFESGKSWRVDFFNNFKSNQQSGWAYQGGKWNSRLETWPQLIFAEPQTIYQNDQQVGVIDGRDLGLETHLTNTGTTERQIDIWAHLFRLKDNKESEFSYYEMIDGMFAKSGIDILPGASEQERLNWVLDRSLLPIMTRGTGITETVSIGPRQEHVVYLRRPKFPGTYVVMWRYADRQTGQIISCGVHPFSAAQPLTTTVEYHYLTVNQVELRTHVPELESVSSVQYTVLQSGQVIDQKRVENVGSGQLLQTTLSAQRWPYGQLVLQVEGLDAAGNTLAQYKTDLQHPHAPSWWQSEAGKQIQVSWPWTAVEASPKQVTVWGRTCQWEKGPMPEHITTQGKALLAQPIRLVIKDQDKKLVDWETETFELKKAAKDKAVYQGNYQTNNLHLQVKTSIEFDGMMRFDMELSSDNSEAIVDQMFLEIPIRKEYAHLFSHANEFGMVPGDEQPSQWQDLFPDAGVIDSDPIRRPFIPWITLCNDQVGLQWFAEENWHWSNVDPMHLIDIIPEDDHVLLRIRLIDQPTRASQPRQITFGLQAWPVKPWPEKEKNVCNYLGNYNIPEDSIFNSPMGGTEEEIRQRIAEAISHEMDVMSIYFWAGDWAFPGSKTNIVGIPDYPQLEHVDYPQFHEDVFKRVKVYAKITQDLGIPAIGHSGFAMPTYVPDFQIWGMEMARRPLADRGAWGFKPCPNSPYTDAYVTRFKELIQQTHWSGAMFDGLMNPQFCNCEFHGCGWRDSQGRLHGKYPIFAQREMAKRIYNVFHGEVDYPGITQGFIYNHSSAPLPSAVYAFSDKTYGGEDADTMRVRTLGQIDLEKQRARYPNAAFGVPCDLLPKFRRAPVGSRGRIAWALQLNMNLLHNRILTHLDEDDYQKDSFPVDRIWKARRWVAASPNNFFGYWKNKEYVTVSPENFYVGFYLSKQGHLLLAVSNWDSNPRRARIKPDLEALGLSGRKLVAEDAITGKPVDLEQNGRLIQLDVTRDGYRLIKIWNDE